MAQLQLREAIRAAMVEEMDPSVGHPPNVGGWPHNEPWLDATRSAGRLNAAIVLAEWIDAIDSAPVRAIRAAADRDPRAAVGEMFAALGIAEWSDETAVAIVTALTAAGGAIGPLPTALTVALTSPEVILS